MRISGHDSLFENAVLVVVGVGCLAIWEGEGATSALEKKCSDTPATEQEIKSPKSLPFLSMLCSAPVNS